MKEVNFLDTVATAAATTMAENTHPCPLLDVSCTEEAAAVAEELPKEETLKAFYHPVVLEKVGILIVLVTTANLTPSRTIEGIGVRNSFLYDGISNQMIEFHDEWLLRRERNV